MTGAEAKEENVLWKWILTQDDQLDGSGILRVASRVLRLALPLAVVLEHHVGDGKGAIGLLDEAVVGDARGAVHGVHHLEAGRGGKIFSQDSRDGKDAALKLMPVAELCKAPFETFNAAH